MIVCRQCGAESAEDDDFCGACGVFLEWEGERVAAVEPEPEPEPEPDEDHKPTLVERVKTAIGLDEGATAPDAVGEPPAPVRTGPAIDPSTADAVTAPLSSAPPPAPPAPPPAAPPEPPIPTATATGDVNAAPTDTSGPPTPGTPAPASRAAAHVAKAPPPAAVTPGRASPAAQKPAAVRRPTRPQAPVRRSRELKPGDLVCGQCGEGNDPSRRFCRKCGNSLAEAETVAIPWWRRLWRWLFRSRKKAVVAGDRPDRWGRGKKKRSGSGMGRSVRRIIMILLPLLVLSGFVGPLRPSVRSLARKVSAPVLDRIRPPQDPVRPISVVASSTAGGHTPEAAIDGVRTTHWSEGAPGDGEGQGLIITFDGAVDISRIGFTLGGSNKPEDFQAHPRPKAIHLVFSDGTAKDLTLKDKADFQRVSVKAKDVTTVELQIVSVYRSLQGSSESSFAEIEFFGEPAA